MSASIARPTWLYQTWLTLLLAAIVGGMAGCGAMNLVDGTPYLGRSYDGRESTAVLLLFTDGGAHAVFTAELPSGEQCTGTFRFVRESQPLNFLPPPTRTYIGLLDSGLSPPCAEWAADGKDVDLMLSLSYHPLIGRYRAGLARYKDERRVSGDWILLRSDPPSS